MTEMKRRFGRFEINLPAHIILDGITYPSVVRNLSVGGLFLDLVLADLSSPPPKINLGTVVDLSVQLNQPVHTIETSARVTWKKQTTGVGLAFDKLSPFDVWALIQQSQSPAEAFHFKAIDAEPSVTQQID